MSQLVPGYELLEIRIGYEFKHKHLLLMALTHPTHASGFSECYQRLEFLGDAILGLFYFPPLNYSLNKY